jgi:hypothetical protein
VDTRGLLYPKENRPQSILGKHQTKQAAFCLEKEWRELRLLKTPVSYETKRAVEFSRLKKAKES